jgi:hypothetical protein
LHRRDDYRAVEEQKRSGTGRLLFSTGWKLKGGNKVTKLQKRQSFWTTPALLIGGLFVIGVAVYLLVVFYHGFGLLTGGARVEVDERRAEAVTGKIDALLEEELKRHLDSPAPISKADRQSMFEDLTQAVNQDKIVPDFSKLIIEGAEEPVRGLKTITAIQSMGLQKGDLILHINGISPESKKRWGDVFGVIESATLITYAYVRDKQLHLQVYEVQ